MLTTLKKRITHGNLLVIFTAILFFSCQKDLSLDNSGVGIQPPDLSTKINSSVSGFVTDENNAAVMGATVQFGTTNITTDKYGYFEAKNIQVVKNAAVVTVNKTGYFKGIKTYIAKEGKAAFFRIKLIPKTNVGNINAASGGTVTLANGLSIKLPAGGIVNAATNSPYTGTVNIAAFWINPTAVDLNQIMPGDLRGINTEGSLKLLQTFGMTAVELTGSAGELLQIVNGRKATLSLTIPPSLIASAPATIPLWYFDEANGLWKQEGSATKTGNTYTGDVGHFSFWNYDQPGNLVQFDCTLKNSAGNPLGYTLVRLTVNGMASAYGYTDSSGYVSGAIFANSNFLLEVFPNYGCSGPVYSQTFTTGTTNISLGVITIAAASNSATLTGTVTNCNNTPVTNGYILLNDVNNIYTRYPLNSSGAYSISKLFCSLPQTISFIGEDIANAQQSATVSYTVNAGANVIPNIQACAVATQQFLNYSINGTTYNFSYPADTFYYNNNAVQSLLFLTGSSIASGHSGNLRVGNTGLAIGSVQTLDQFKPTQVQDTFRITTPVLVNITEYGAIGQFAAGNFSGVFTGAAPANTQYNVTCNFRLRRNN